MPVFKSLDISENAKHAISHGIFKAISQDIPEIISDYKLPTNNGVGQFRWNFIHKRVEENLGGRFQHSYVPRGPWKVLLLFEMELGFTFSIMSEHNLMRLQRHLPKNPHYLEALISKNVGYDVIQGQMRLVNYESSRSPSDVEKLRDVLLTDFAGIIKNHILILFDHYNNNITSIKAVLLTPQFDTAFEEDWGMYIKEPYIIGRESILNSMATEDLETFVSLKPKKNEELNEALISLPPKSNVVGK